MKEFWQDEKTKYVAFIGKDNVVFHTIIFPAMLMAWNDGNEDKYLLPQNVPANEFLNFEGKKFSKSRGWGIDVDEFLELFPADLLRYTLGANLPENKDTDFYWKEFQAKTNSELADILGNFINRTFIFAQKHFEGIVPEQGELKEIDIEMLKTISEAPKKVGALIEKYKVKDAIFEMMNLARAGNKYFNDSEPWVVMKEDKQRGGTIINICLQTIYTLAEIFSPVIPFTSDKIFAMLNSKKLLWAESGDGKLVAGHKLKEAEILFKKIEDKDIEVQISKFCVSDESEEEKVEEIAIDDFAKVELKVAEILQAESIKKSDKLLKLQVKIGKEERQVVAGIAKSYKPEELIGRKVVMVANLKKAKLLGTESQGMILAVEDSEGGLNVIEVGKKVETGTRVR